ncbi:hypothetical protein QZH41_000318 [Actinostola sp. cb2023]|nr:hypothetical protein QZH41_000318 [Actinostola sp. cb2023]
MAANMEIYSEKLDELLAGLTSMGFDFEECHEALQAGHTNLESAVEWLIERKTAIHVEPPHSKTSEI